VYSFLWETHCRACIHTRSHKCYLAPNICRWTRSALTPTRQAEPILALAIPEGWKAELTMVLYLFTERHPPLIATRPGVALVTSRSSVRHPAVTLPSLSHLFPCFVSYRRALSLTGSAWCSWTARSAWTSGLHQLIWWLRPVTGQWPSSLFPLLWLLPLSRWSKFYVPFHYLWRVGLANLTNRLLLL